MDLELSNCAPLTQNGQKDKNYPSLQCDLRSWLLETNSVFYPFLRHRLQYVGKQLSKYFKTLYTDFVQYRSMSRRCSLGLHTQQPPRHTQSSGDVNYQRRCSTDGSSYDAGSYIHTQLPKGLGHGCFHITGEVWTAGILHDGAMKVSVEGLGQSNDGCDVMLEYK